MHVTPVVAAVLGSLFFSPAIGAGLGDVAAPTDAIGAALYLVQIRVLLSVGAATSPIPAPIAGEKKREPRTAATTGVTCIASPSGASAAPRQPELRT